MVRQEDLAANRDTSFKRKADGDKKTFAGDSLIGRNNWHEPKAFISYEKSDLISLGLPDITSRYNPGSDIYFKSYSDLQEYGLLVKIFLLP